MVIVFTIVFVAAIAVSRSHQSAFTSAEVRFADASPSGLQIMPASCASSPAVEHRPGECSIPPGYCTISVSPTSMNVGAQSTVLLTWNTGPAIVDGEVAYTIKGRIDPAPGPVYAYGANYAVAAPSQTTIFTYSGAYYDTNGNNDSNFVCNTTLTVSGIPRHLYISKAELGRANNSSVAVGDIIAYRISVTNQGATTETNMTITDAIPPGTHLVWQGGGTDTNSGSAPGSTGTISWTQNSVPPGWSGYVDFNVQVDSGASFCNTATVSSTQSAALNSNQFCNTVAASGSPPVCTVYLDASQFDVSGNVMGYKAWNGTSNRQVNRNFSPTLCVVNTSGKTYFVPANTGPEAQAFINAVNGGNLPGVTLSPL